MITYPDTCSTAELSCQFKVYNYVTKQFVYEYSYDNGTNSSGKTTTKKFVMDNENNKLYIHMSYYNGTSKNIELNLNTMEETVIYSTESNEYAFVPYEYGNDVLYFQDYNSTNGLNMHIYDSNSLLYTVDTSNKYFIDESSIATKHAYWIENSVFSLYELDAYEGSFTKKYDINNFPTSPIEFVNENYILVSTEATNCHYKDETFNNSMYELFSISDRAIVESIYMC